MNRMNKQQNAGFTMVEMIIIVGVMAILVTVSFGSIFDFIDRQKMNTENAQLIEIRRALETYAREVGSLPLDPGEATSTTPPWYEILSGYSNLSPDEIRFDNWEQSRVYKRGDVTENYRETDFQVYYATVYSAGSNRLVDSLPTIVPQRTDGTVIEDEGTGTVWWDAVVTTIQADYADFEVVEDDMAIKFTDLQIKTENYDLARRRLGDVVQALQNYADTKVNEALVVNAADLAAGRAETYAIESLIFYPPSNIRTGDPVDNANYMDQVWVDADNFIGDGDGALQETSDRVVVDEGNDAARLTSMTNLMRLLGLPDSHCCNPLDIREDAGGRYERPFFYYANPRPRAAGNSCGTRPSTGPFLPPRMTVEHVSPGGTELPTCG